MFGFFSAKKSVVGIDIGASSIKLAEIADTSGGYQLTCCARIPLDRGAIEKGLINDSAAVTSAIKALLKESGCAAKRSATALSGFSVLINKATFSDSEEGDIRQVIIDEADEYMPIDAVENISFDIHILGANQNNAEKVDVIIAAAKKDVIAEYRSAVESAGIKLVLMDVDSFALETAYEENYEFSDDDVVALIDIGAAITNINIVRGGQSVFTRNIHMGGNLVTEAIQTRRGISFEDAEAWKIGNADGDAASLEAAVPGEDLQGESLLVLAEPILAEIERSIDFFVSSAGLIFIKTVLLSGGGSLIPGLMDDLSQRLRCDVEPFDPLKAVSCDTARFAPQYLKELAPFLPLAAGLALRKVDEE